MLKPTSMTFTERSAEWVRDDVPFGNWIIDTAEHYTYSAPRKGGPGVKRLRSVGIGAAACPSSSIPATRVICPRRSSRCSQRHCPVRVSGTVPSSVNGGPPVLVTSYRPSTAYPSIVAYVLWIDHTRTDLAYYPGRYEPPSAVNRVPMMVPVDQRSRLLATFNGGLHPR